MFVNYGFKSYKSFITLGPGDSLGTGKNGTIPGGLKTLNIIFATLYILRFYSQVTTCAPYISRVTLSYSGTIFTTLNFLLSSRS